MTKVHISIYSYRSTNLNIIPKSAINGDVILLPSICLDPTQRIGT